MHLTQGHYVYDINALIYINIHIYIIKKTADNPFKVKTHKIKG